jgi:hypothetical protein
MSKSHVTMEQRCCLVCKNAFDTGNILLDTRMRETFDSHTVVGWGLCPAHQKLFDQGYVALIEVADQEGMNKPVTPETASYLGRVAHIKRSAYDRIFKGAPLKDNQAIAFAGPAVMDMLAELERNSHDGPGNK